ncbi:hypothetical protein GQ42DRAFT_77198 [Ramicandelaber brevisporus]|nr:hypothetical protein GQ42DRAFT_77198 [Ramicandelaber brevisporus]
MAVDYAALVNAHAWLMFIGWGVLVPLAIFSARFARPFDTKLRWFQVHRAANTLGLLCILAGFAVIVYYWQSSYQGAVAHFSNDHGQLGLAVVILGVLQPLNAFFRPHREQHRNGLDGLPGTKGREYRFWNKPWTIRRAWEYLHHYVGRAAMIGAIINLFWGLWYKGIMPGDMWHSALVGWVAAVGGLYVILDCVKFYRDRVQDPVRPITHGGKQLARDDVESLPSTKQYGSNRDLH